MKKPGSRIAEHIEREYYKKRRYLEQKEKRKHSGVEQGSAHQPHTLEVDGSNPSSATNNKKEP